MNAPAREIAPPHAIKVHDLGVRFYKSRRRRHSLRQQLFRPGSVKPSEQFWGLRNVSFTIQPGEAVGVVGANGQGKSTLLKLVAGVMLPDEGTVDVVDKVAPLIEVTGGFVGDLTVRDNIYLTAGLHGLTKDQVDERFDEIVEFAEIGEFLDMSYRHLSSGMKVRVGFSVITQLDEPIILVDEVLAVGDRRFKKKCATRLEELFSGGGRCSSSRTARRTCRSSAPGALPAEGPADPGRDDRRGARGLRRVHRRDRGGHPRRDPRRRVVVTVRLDRPR